MDKIRRKIIHSHHELGSLLEPKREAGSAIVLTNGLFDKFHVGYTRLFDICRTRADIVIVGVNSDLSVEKLHWPRTAYREDDRLWSVASQKHVDYVTLFDDLEVTSLLKTLRPDIYLKTGPFDSQVMPANQMDTYRETGCELEYLGRHDAFMDEEHYEKYLTERNVVITGERRED